MSNVFAFRERIVDAIRHAKNDALTVHEYQELLNDAEEMEQEVQRLYHSLETCLARLGELEDE